MTDWDKTAEKIDEILALTRASSNILGELLLSRPEPDALAVYMEDALKRAGEERVTRAMLDHVVRDMMKIREDTGYWKNEVHKLLHAHREIERRLKALEEQVSYPAKPGDKP